MMEEDESVDNIGKRRTVRKRLISDDDDEVLNEIDVYLCKKKSDSLYVLQFPLHPNDQDGDHAPKVEVKFKPIQQKLEMKIHLDVSSRNYDKSRGEQIAVNCSSSKSAADEPIFRKVMDYQIFENNNVGGFHTGCYAAAFFKNGSLYLNPVNDILQMKPNFFYLDAADEKPKASAMNVDGGGESSQDEESETAQAVRVKFDVEESEAAKKRRITSYSYMQKIQSEERWSNLRYKNIKDQESLAIKNEIISGNESGDDEPKFTNCPQELLRYFVPKASEEETSKPRLPSNVISLTQLRSLPLADQVQALMTNVKVARFAQLFEWLSPNADEQIVLKSLQSCATLVQGCWVVKSDILYPRHAISPKTGVAGDVLSKARDFALYKFTQNALIARREISSVVKIPSEDLQDILSQLARFKCQRGWAFLYPTDEEFIKNHTDIVQRQSTMWEAKFQTLAHQMNLRQRRISDNIKSPSRTRHRTGSSHSTTEAHMMSGDDEDGARRSNSISRQYSAEKAKDSLLNGPASTSLTENGNNKDSPLNIEFRKFLYEKFSTRPAMTLNEIKRQLVLKLSESPPGHILSTGIRDDLIERSALELGAVKIFNKKMSEPVFAFAGVGSHPDLRRVAVKVLEQKNHIRFNTFKQACVDALGEVPSDAEIRKVLGVSFND